jgi:phosphoadenosine phosphosulfate reductase
LSKLFHSIKTAAKITNRVLVSFSGGKDSVVTLDLAIKHFDKVDAFFMYTTKGLSFQDSIINYYEKKHDIKIYKTPHFMLSAWLRYGAFRLEDYSVPIVSIKEIYDYMREKTGTYWIAAGETIKDSIVRRAMIKQSGTIDTKRGRFYPIAEWSKKDVVSYIRQNKLKVGIESNLLGWSFNSLMPRDLMVIKDKFPADYKIIESWFPLVGANIAQEQYTQDGKK